MRASVEHRDRSRANARMAKLTADNIALKAENRALKAPVPKWVRLLSEHRVRVLVCAEEFVTADVTGDSGLYRVDIYRDDSGRTVRECSCPNAEYHPIHPTCHHLKAVEAVWKLEPR